MDWFFHDLKARYSFQIKLRDTGSYGFLLPSDSIVPTGQEVFAAIRFLGDFLLGNNGIEMTPRGSSNGAQEWKEAMTRSESDTQRRAREFVG